MDLFVNDTQRSVADRRRKRRNAGTVTAQDQEELREAYTFAPTSDDAAAAGAAPKTWQERMARRYESHLYREFVLADFSRYERGQIGFRWRTKEEVVNGRGFDSCGNKECPSYQQLEGKRYDIEAARRASLGRTSEAAVCKYMMDTKGAVVGRNEEGEEDAHLSKLPFGCGLCDYEVPFSYIERGESKTELVKLRLCLRCAPKLFHGRGGALGARRARDALRSNIDQEQTEKCEEESTEPKQHQSSDHSLSSTSSSERSSRRERKRRSKKKRVKKKRERRRKRDRHDIDSSKFRRERKRKKEEDTDSSGDDADNFEGCKAEKELLARVEKIHQCI